MKSLYCLIALFVVLLSLSSCNGSNEDLKSKLLPQISEAYKNGKWEQVIQLTDSLRNDGISYTDYIGDKGFDVAYCEALIATGQADKAVAEIRHHISTVNPQDFYAYHTLGVAYSELKDTANAIDSSIIPLESIPDMPDHIFISLIYMRKKTLRNVWIITPKQSNYSVIMKCMMKSLNLDLNHGRSIALIR